MVQGTLKISRSNMLDRLISSQMYLRLISKYKSTNG